MGQGVVNFPLEDRYMKRDPGSNLSCPRVTLLPSYCEMSFIPPCTPQHPAPTSVLLNHAPPGPPTPNMTRSDPVGSCGDVRKGKNTSRPAVETLTSEQVEGVPGDDLGGHLESRIPF